MRPIWYFVGILLSLIGLVVVIAGVLNLVSPPSANPHLPHGQPALAYLHVNLWWGGVVLVTGLIFLITNRNARIGEAPEQAASPSADSAAVAVASEAEPHA